MRPGSPRWIGLIAAVLLLIALSSYFLIRKTCCSEQLSDRQIQELERTGSGGDVSAMMRLYFFYDEAEQPSKAAAWLKRAADAGDGEAEMAMFSRLDGSDDPGQKRLAMDYLHRAAGHGSATAQAVLGERYRKGDGVAQNLDTAKRWFQTAARAGDTDAILAACDIAVNERDIAQCRECLLLETRALKGLHAKSYLASRLQEQQKRIGRILDEQSSGR